MKILESLQQNTDKPNLMTTSEIVQRLSEIDILCNRRIFTWEITLLNEHGYEIHSCYIDKSKGYYISERTFSIPEVKALIDAVEASHLLTESKTKKLINKITAFTGSNQAEVLKRKRLIISYKEKSSNKILSTILYFVNNQQTYCDNMNL